MMNKHRQYKHKRWNREHTLSQLVNHTDDMKSVKKFCSLVVRTEFKAWVKLVLKDAGFSKYVCIVWAASKMMIENFIIIKRVRKANMQTII